MVGDWSDGGRGGLDEVILCVRGFEQDGRRGECLTQPCDWMASLWTWSTVL